MTARPEKDLPRRKFFPSRSRICPLSTAWNPVFLPSPVCMSLKVVFFNAAETRPLRLSAFWVSRPEKESLARLLPLVNTSTQRAMVPCHRSHRPQLESHADVAGVRNEDTNNLVYALSTPVLYRMEDVQSGMKDEVDGLYLHLASADDSASTAKVVRGILNASHHNAGDFNVIVPRNSSPNKSAPSNSLTPSWSPSPRSPSSSAASHHEHHARRHPRTYPRNRVRRAVGARRMDYHSPIRY